MKRISLILLCLITFLPFSKATAQEDPKKVPQIKVENSREAVLFLISWSNRKSSTVKFPPFHLLIGKEQMHAWENMVIREIQSNYDAFEVPFSYDIYITYPEGEKREEKSNLDKIQGKIQDILAMVGGESDIKEDGKICITSTMDWTSVGFELDDFDMSPSDLGKTKTKNNLDGTSVETTPLENGGNNVVFKDANGTPTSEFNDSGDTYKKNADGSITTKNTKSTIFYDKDGKESWGYETTEESTVAPTGTSSEKKTTTEIVNSDGSKTKTVEWTKTDNTTGEEESFIGTEEFGADGKAKSLSWKWTNTDGSSDEITYNPETGEITHKHKTAEENSQSQEPEKKEEPNRSKPEKNRSEEKEKSGVEMTTDGLVLESDLAFCFPAEMFNLLINWNKLGAAVTDPSPIDDEEIFEGGQSIAPIDPPKNEADWTPSVRYLNILPGGGITDPPKR